MKILYSLLFFLCITANAQTYQELWKTVINYEAEARIAPANEEVKKIYALAKKDNNEPQIIKTLLFLSRYSLVLEEDAPRKILIRLQQEKESLSEPGRAIVESMYAENLENLFVNLRYEIRNRMTLDNATLENIGEWSTDNFRKEIAEAFNRSIENKMVLYHTPLLNYKDIMELNPAYINTGRSVYDYLAERKLNSSIETPNIPADSIGFLFKDSQFFLDYVYDGEAKNNLLNKIALLQEIESLYINEKDTTALQGAVLRRLAFAANLTYSRHNALYLETILHYIDKWDKKSPYTYQAMLVGATLYKSLANKTTNREYNIKAIALCDEIISNRDYNNLYHTASALQQNIKQPWVSIVTEEHPFTGRPMLAKVNFSNLTSITVKIYREYYGKQNKVNDSTGLYITKPVIEKTYQLPEGYGYFNYETEIILPPLESGKYSIVAFPENRKDTILAGLSNSIPGYSVQVSDITVVNEDNKYIILDKETGKPLKKAKIISNGKTIYTDRNGYAELKLTKSGNHESLVIHGTDTLYLNQHHNVYTRSEKKEKIDFIDATSKVYFDRAIYRPGQTVYFKGIVTQNTNDVVTVVPDIHVIVTIHDATSNELKEMRLKTNEFGSFNGEFEIPKNVMTGNFYLSVEEDDEYEEKEHPFWDRDNLYFDDEDFSFRVEEYKRPTFEAAIENYTGNAVINDTIILTGNAISFSGAPISGAKVSYTVKRQTTFANEYRYYEYDDITEGEITAGINGKFKIEFSVTPDENADAAKLPVFKYRIECTITDATGEAHECETYVYAGYHAVQVSANMPVEVTAGDKSEITVKTTNLNNKFVPAKCNVTIYRLADDKNVVYKERPWSAPELQIIPEAEFRKNFPNIPYNSYEAKPVRVRAEKVYEKSFISEQDQKLVPWDATWSTGKYEMVVTATDEKGNTRETTIAFTYNKTKEITGAHILKYQVLNTDFIKDGYVELELYTAVPCMHINIVAQYKNEGVYNKWKELKPGSTTVKVPVKKDWDRVDIGLYYLWENQLDKEEFFKELTLPEEEIGFITNVINNKLTPGRAETWSFTLTNSNRLPAEVLASMYDSSLDEFASDYWWNLKENQFYNYFTYRRILTNSTYQTPYYAAYPTAPITLPQPDKLNEFKFDITDTDIRLYSITPENTTTIEGAFILSGTVADEIGPLPGASVIIVGTQRSTQTDIEGNYSIQVKAGETVEFYYVAYQPQTMVAGYSYTLDIILKPTYLEAVVKDSYRTITRKSVSAASVSVFSVEDRANSNILQSLQGQVAGLNIASGSGHPGEDVTIILRGVSSMNGNPEPLFIVDGIPVDEDGFMSIKQNDIVSYSILKDAAATSIYGNQGANGVIVITTRQGMMSEMEQLTKVATRKNLKETAFFYPDIKTDKEGNFSFSFTSPEALTTWNLRLLAHNKEAQSGVYSYMAFTQKDLMISPNMPRFFREGDKIIIKAKIANTTNEAKTGKAMLELFDAKTMKPLEGVFEGSTIVPFSLEAKESAAVSWTINIPSGIQGIQYKIVASAGNFSDGEENIIPVLSNRMMVTESVPVWVKPNSEKSFTLTNLQDAESSTRINHSLVLEYTSNPVWMALKSLPYLMAFEHDCSEQLFSKIYANVVASHILNANPKIADVLKEWRKNGTKLSKFEQNEELKSVIMAESPWMLDVQDDAEQKNRLALFFDLDKMAADKAINLSKLKERQESSGGFAWFSGGKEDDFITRHIIAGIGRLKKIGAIEQKEETTTRITKKGIGFINKSFIDNYTNRINNKKKYEPTPADITKALHYLYARSYHLDNYPIEPESLNATNEYIRIIKKDWINYSLYEKGMAALVLHRYGDAETPRKIIKSLKDSAALNDENGMYWVNNKSGWYWYNSKVETQALLIEAFTEIENDTASADAMKVWLLKQKQGKNWSTTKSTTEAAYALLMSGSNWLEVNDNTNIKLGTANINDKLKDASPEAGSGYIKLNWGREEIKTDMATTVISNNSSVPGYGGLYWQYFEDIDKIKPAQQGLLNIKREIYSKQDNRYTKLTEGEPLKLGSVVTIKLTVTANEDLEYVHMKDVRASAFEPLDVLSGYHYTEGTGYYRSTRDAATHFFFNRLNKGTYVLQYDVRVNNAGEFSSGISTIQSMYAPEFSGHSEGTTIRAAE